MEKYSVNRVLLRVSVLVCLACTLGVAYHLLWLYRHDAFFRNGVALRVYKLTTSEFDRRVLLVGDSDIAGMSCGANFTGWKVLNLGVPGIKTQQMRNYITTIFGELPKVEASVLWVGINDLRMDVDPEDVIRNELLIMSDLSGISRRQAVVMQPSLPEGDGLFASKRINMQLLRVNKELSVAASARHIAPLTLPIAMDKLLFEDGLHLSAAGDQRVCTEIERWLR